MLAASSKPTVAAASGWTAAAISGLLDLWDQQSGCGCNILKIFRIQTTESCVYLFLSQT